MAGVVKASKCGYRNQGLLNAVYTEFYSRIGKLEAWYLYSQDKFHCDQKCPVVPSGMPPRSSQTRSHTSCLQRMRRVAV